jgi:predicted deacylase
MADDAEGLIFEVLPRDLAPYKAGNVGVDYVHRFSSGKPGPHVLINALTHGNEFCGMVAATHLLDAGVRPKIGTLTISFANVEAYQTFDKAKPFESRLLVHNLNRIWSQAELDGAGDSPELRRARALRPVVAAADHVLDIHSTSQDVQPFWVYPKFAPNGEAALAIGRPSVHLVMPAGLGSGTPVIQYGKFSQPEGRGAAMVVECGQHFLAASADLAIDVARDFLAHFGLIDADPARPKPAPQRRFELVRTYVIKTKDYKFVRPVKGFEVFKKDELVATDGAEEIRAPCEDCTILMPARKAIPGREGVYLAKPMA